MSQVYQQLLLEEESKKYTSIKGLYQYNTLPFGVSWSPGTFQSTMENLLQGIPHVVVRVDDILVSGKDDPDQIANLEMILSRLSTAGLKLKLDKFSFLRPEVTYYGHVFNGQGNALSNLSQPKWMPSRTWNAQPYHRFLPDVATVLYLELLRKLLEKDTKWQWLGEQQTALEKFKELLQSAQLLVHFDPQKKLILASDASDYGVGAVLFHRMDYGTERPIGDIPRSLRALFNTRKGSSGNSNRCEEISFMGIHSS